MDKTAAGRHQAHFQGREAGLEALLRRLRLRRIVRCIPPHSRVVDVGCGFDGFLLHALAARIANGVGFDLVVGESRDPKIQLRPGNANQPLPLPDKSVDVVVSMANLEHLEQPQLFLQEAWRVLVPGGRLVLTTPTTYAKPVLEFLAYRLHIVSEQEIRDHKTYFQRASLRQAVAAAGFGTIRHRYFQCWMNNFLVASK